MFKEIYPGKFIAFKFLKQEDQFLIYDIISCLIREEFSNDGFFSNHTTRILYKVVNQQGQEFTLTDLNPEDIIILSSGFNLEFLLTHQNQIIREFIKRII